MTREEELVERIRRDLIDGYDEELEMEIEDRSVDDALLDLDGNAPARSERAGPLPSMSASASSTERSSISISSSSS